MKIHNVTQGSGEWLALRLGVVTASEVDALVTPLWKQRSGEGYQTYLCKKVCEKVLGFAPDAANTWQMEHGSIMEHEAIPWFEFTHDTKVDRVGFITSDDSRSGCSPDGLIGQDGGIEVKVPSPATHLKYILNGELPADYRAQVHFSMYVTGRKWWKFLSYNRQFPPLLLTVERDEKIIALFDAAMDLFNKYFDDAFSAIKALRDAENAIKTAQYYASNPQNEK